MAEPTIKALCEQYELSQAALARKFGIPYRTVQDWYAERKPATEYVVKAIARVLFLEEKLKKQSDKG